MPTRKGHKVSRRWVEVRAGVPLLLGCTECRACCKTESVALRPRNVAASLPTPARKRTQPTPPSAGNLSPDVVAIIAQTSDESRCSIDYDSALRACIIIYRCCVSINLTRRYRVLSGDYLDLLHSNGPLWSVFLDFFISVYRFVQKVCQPHAFKQAAIACLLEQMWI